MKRNLGVLCIVDVDIVTRGHCHANVRFTRVMAEPVSGKESAEFMPGETQL
jgi:hypothetical protein